MKISMNSSLFGKKKKPQQTKNPQTNQKTQTKKYNKTNKTPKPIKQKNPHKNPPLFLTFFITTPNNFFSYYNPLKTKVPRYLRDWCETKRQWKMLVGTGSPDENAEGTFQTATMKAFHQLKYICVTSEINSAWNHCSFIDTQSFYSPHV